MEINTREMKFRVWDYKRGRYLIEQPSPGSEITSIAFDGSLMTQYYSGNTKTQAGFAIQQFVGIRDKNSKEIYEGDILTGHMGYSPDVKLTGVVEFSTETLGYGLRFNPNPGTKDSLTEDLFLVHNLEVVGNIYENGDTIPDYCSHDER